MARLLELLGPENDLAGDDARLAAWARRLWKLHDGIYGGYSFIDDPNLILMYPSQGLGQGGGLASDEELTLLANHLARVNGSLAPAISQEEIAALRPPPDECPEVEY